MENTQRVNNFRQSKEEASIEILGRRRSTLHLVVNINQTRKASFSDNNPNKNLFQQFFNSIKPFEKDDWFKYGRLSKITSIFKIPCSIVLNVTIPVIDLEKEVHGWSKLLNILQIIIIPQIVLLMQNTYMEPYKFQSHIYLYMFIASAPIACILFFITRTDRPPKYHFVLCLISIATSILIIGSIAREVVNILFTIGMAASRTKSYLAVTLLSAGNSISDLLANPTLAKQGYPKMALAACYGGPMFNILMGITIIFMKKINKDGDPTFISKGLLGSNAMIFIQIILSMTVFALICTNFNFRRSIGFFILIVFLLHITYACLGEFEIIHPYGTDHES